MVLILALHHKPDSDKGGGVLIALHCCWFTPAYTETLGL